MRPIQRRSRGALPAPLAIALVLLGGALSISCGSLSGGKAPTITTDPPRPQMTFAAVVLGQTGEQVVTVRNIGDRELIVRGMTITENPGTPAGTFAIAENAPREFTLGPQGSANDSMPILIRFTPPNDQPQSAVLRIDSNDPNPQNNPYLLDLLTPALFPQLVVSPEMGVDFGQVQEGTTSTRCRPLGGGEEIDPRCQVTLSNGGHVDLDITGLCFADPGSTFVFRWQGGIDGPTTCTGGTAGGEGQARKIVLRPGEQRVVEIDYVGEGTVSSTNLVVQSSDPASPETNIKVVAQDHPVCTALVVDGMSQTIVPGVNPQINFGVIEPGQSLTKELAICNCEPLGGFDLEVIAAAFTPASDPQFSISRPPELPATLPPQMKDASCVSFDVTYAPTSESSAGATIEVVQGAGVTTNIDIFARPCGNPPVAVARVNGQKQEAVVVPLSTVNLSATDSRDANGQTTGLTYRWEFTRAPGASLTSGSAYSFNRGDPVERCEGDQTTQSVACFFVDQAGEYEARLTVTDREGCSATDTIQLRAVPANAIHVEMTWPIDADIDLHMTQPGGIFGCFNGDAGGAESDSDCAYCNCRGTDMDGDGVPDLSPTLDWGPMVGMGDGQVQTNPGLDIDRICVSGDGALVPENIVLGSQDFPPYDGGYHVAAHYFGNCSGAGAVPVTVRIYISGILRFESTRTLEEPGNVWHVARIDWMGGGATICELDRFYGRPPQPLPSHPADDSDSICQNL